MSLLRIGCGGLPVLRKWRQGASGAWAKRQGEGDTHLLFLGGGVLLYFLGHILRFTLISISILVHLYSCLFSFCSSVYPFALPSHKLPSPTAPSLIGPPPPPPPRPSLKIHCLPRTFSYISPPQPRPPPPPPSDAFAALSNANTRLSRPNPHHKSAQLHAKFKMKNLEVDIILILKK